MIGKNLAFLIYFFLTILVIGSVIFAYVFFYKEDKNSRQVEMSSIEEIGEMLKNNKNISINRNEIKKQNQFLTNADKLASGRKFELAIEEYKKAIDKTTIPEEAGIIKISMGRSYYGLGEFELGSNVFKEIVNNTDYSNVTKAYAIEAMGAWYYSIYDQRLFDSIFTGDPYRGFFDGKDKELAMRKLFEYGNSFYPLALSASRIAQWYASELVRIKASGVNDKETELKIKNMRAVIVEKISLINNGVKAMENTPNAQRIPVVLNRQGIISMKMYLFGDKSFGNPADFFEKSLVYSKLYNLTATEGFTYYNYAVFLARVYGKEKENEISILLSNFYKTDRYKDTDLFLFFKNQKNIEGSTRNDILFLATFDPEFKKVLSSLGWSF